MPQNTGSGRGVFGMETLSTDDIFKGSDLLRIYTILFTFKYSRAYVFRWLRILCDIPQSINGETSIAS